MSWIELLIPRSWRAEEALAAVGFLREVERAIWRVHGADMADAFAEDCGRWGDALHPVDEIGDDDEDLPF